MKSIDIDPATSLQEVTALVEYYKNRSLVLAQLLRVTTTERDELKARVEELGPAAEEDDGLSEPTAEEAVH